jgi:hypothetical protein
MKRVLYGGLAAGLLLAGLTAAPAVATVVASGPQPVYDATVTPLPPNMWSLGFQATQTAEFGNAVTLAADTGRVLHSATVTFSSWAKHSSWPGYPNDTGFEWPITVNVYRVDSTASTPVVGALIGSVTETVTVPWRPEASTSCSPDDAWSPDNSTDCYHGIAFNHTFDLTDVGAVPDQVIVTVAYNTETWGASPVGVDGPYDSLNVALRDTPVTVGADTDPDDVFWNTETAGNYTDGGSAGVGILREDTGWAPLTPAISLTATTAGCQFSQTGTTLTLLGDCSTDQTIAVPDGFTLDGAGHTITAVDPAGGHFLGAVLTNAGTDAGITIQDVTVTASGLANACDSGADRLRGILLDGVGGTIDHVTVTGVRQGLSGCQEGNAIEARNFAPDGTAASPSVAVTVSNSTVADYQKNGITVTGGVTATITNDSVRGDGPAGYIAQNGIQVSFGASGTVQGDLMAENYYSGGTWTACGLLMYQASGVRTGKNAFSGNQKDVCNYGRGGGSSPSS